MGRFDRRQIVYWKREINDLLESLISQSVEYYSIFENSPCINLDFIL